MVTGCFSVTIALHLQAVAFMIPYRIILLYVLLRIQIQISIQINAITPITPKVGTARILLKGKRKLGVRIYNMIHDIFTVYLLMVALM